MQSRLWDTVDSDAIDESWDRALPPDPARLVGTEIELDFETTGLRWWAGDVPGGAGVMTADGRGFYMAWGHRHGGNNISPENAKRWLQDLRNVTLTNLNTRFEVHNAREWAHADWEANGVHVSDVGHYAALLDDHRQRNSLESLVDEFLVDEKKVHDVNGVHIDPTRMMDYHPSIIAVRAIGDVRQVQKLKKLLWPKLDAEDLQRVRQLEDELIYVVCEMEKNAALFDVEKCAGWAKDCEQDYLRAVYEIKREVGISDFNADSRNDWERLFKHEGIDIVERTEKGAPSFKGKYLKTLDNKNVQLGLRAGQLKFLKSNYLDKALAVVSADGKMRYALHQLRAQKDEHADRREAGTISGRFASTEIVKGEGWNQQQVMKVIKQFLAYGPDYMVRELYLPGAGMKFFSSDAMQIEYRLFAHFSGSKRLIDAYKNNPLMSFHRFMHEIIKGFKPNFSYRQQKDLNFAKVYGAGLKKLALMLEMISESQYKQLLLEGANNNHPWLEEAKKVEAIYNREIPEVSPLLKLASHLAMPHCQEAPLDAPWKGCKKWDDLHKRFPHRGYVKTVLGRRTRFPDLKRIHKAFNGVDQGTAADIMKRKLIELHRERKHTGFLMRFTVHDEVDGDVPDQESYDRVMAILNAQSFPEITVPILWEGSMGANWRECADEDPGRKAA